MKIIRRILIAIGILFVAQYFIVPAIVLYFVRKAPPLTRVVPMELKELTVSQAPGSIYGYSRTTTMF